ncbi:hypothetical protein UT300007_12820 [Clostridium sp. CTA-7]
MKERLGNNMEISKFYKVTDIQEILGVSRSTAYNLVSDNNFPKIKIEKLIKIPKHEFNLWLENSLEKGCI